MSRAVKLATRELVATSLFHLTGDASDERVDDVLTKITKHTVASDPAECWKWANYHLPSGVPTVWVGTQQSSVGRVLLGLTSSRIVVDYLCGNNWCVNPNHIAEKDRFPPKQTCSGEGCQRPARVRGMCQMHLLRWKVATGTECTIDGCTTGQRGKGYCHAHLSRLNKYGDPLGRAAKSVRPNFRGEKNHRWNAQGSYATIHQRLRKTRGRARDYICIDCGKQAAHWSYNHQASDEQQGTSGPFSMDESNYDPRCHRCHNKIDHPNDNYATDDLWELNPRPEKEGEDRGE